jgi:hypothetical protein
MAIAEERRSFINIFLIHFTRRRKDTKVVQRIKQLGCMLLSNVRMLTMKKLNVITLRELKWPETGEGKIAEIRSLIKVMNTGIFLLTCSRGEYMAKMPAEIINKHWPTFILCSRPAGRNGCTSLNSGTERIFVKNCRIKRYRI